MTFFLLSICSRVFQVFLWCIGTAYILPAVYIAHVCNDFVCILCQCFNMRMHTYSQDWLYYPQLYCVVRQDTVMHPLIAGSLQLSPPQIAPLLYIPCHWSQMCE